MTQSPFIRPIIVLFVIVVAGLALVSGVLKHYRQDKENTCSLALASKQLEQEDRERARKTKALEDGTQAVYEANTEKAAKHCEQRSVDLSRCKEYWDIVNKRQAIETKHIIDNLEELKRVEKESCK